MRRSVVVAFALWVLALPGMRAHAQLFNLVNLDHLNSKLSGRMVDHTRNHGGDRQQFSSILGKPRDLYVYLPPGYNPSIAYPLIVFLHGSDIDEHHFLDPNDMKRLDRMMASGQLPPMIIAAPDGTYEGVNHIAATNSFWVNGRGGRFEDHIVYEVMPFLMRTYSIRPEPQAHALIGVSAGGYGAMGIGLKHRDLFSIVATIAGPLNMRYDACPGGYRAQFDPATYRERMGYDPELIIARYYFGIIRRRVKKFLEPVYGSGPEVVPQIIRDNPVDLLISTNLQPGEMNLYVNYPDKDNYNFDAQDKSFAWIASQRGIHVDLSVVRHARHDLPYIEKAEPAAYVWVGCHILPPIAR